MKKIITILAFVLLPAMLFCSCSKINMTSLLSYENEDYSVTMAVRYGNETIDVDIIKSGEVYTFTIADEITFVFDGKWRVTYGGTTVSLNEKTSARAMPTLIKETLTMSPSDSWTITETEAGGIRLYECVCDGVTLYIDAATYHPLKIVTDKFTADITSFA